MLRKGQLMGAPSLNDLVVDWKLNTTNQCYNDLPYMKQTLYKNIQ